MCVLITDTCLVSIQVSLLQQGSTEKRTWVISLATLTYPYTCTYIHMHLGTNTCNIHIQWGHTFTVCLWEASGHSHSRMEAEALSVLLAQAEHMLLGLIQSQLPTETIQHTLPLVSKYKQPWMSAAALWSSPSCGEHHQVVLCPWWPLAGNVLSTRAKRNIHTKCWILWLKSSTYDSVLFIKLEIHYHMIPVCKSYDSSSH